jgi:hypothetical protein
MPDTNSDLGAETARFQAFKNRSDDLPPAWQMKASGSKIAVLIVAVIVVAILALLIGTALVA